MHCNAENEVLIVNVSFENVFCNLPHLPLSEAVLEEELLEFGRMPIIRLERKSTSMMEDFGTSFGSQYGWL